MQHFAAYRGAPFVTGAIAMSNVLAQDGTDQPVHAAKSTLILGALGVVYGDIGTSPLYALKECFNPSHGILPTPENILGILSLIFWTITVVVSLKYVLFIMRADNQGEGGILALQTLAQRGARTSRALAWVAMLGLVGAAMFYGDSMLTPAISVLSAVEGLEIATPAFKPYVIPLTIVILVALFALQSRGTASIGRLFGPVMVAWFTTLGVIGVMEIQKAPQVLAALNPLYAFQFLVTYKLTGFIVLGAVFLAVTGAEALYVDMGHFGRSAIRTAWFWIAMPGLVLNYFGQGALLIQRPEAVENPFYLILPAWGVIPMVALAAAATVIASQAVISGAYSITAQAIRLGYCPRLSILHTSETSAGQIYMPFINWLLLACVIALVLGFKSSSALASAYGLSVVVTMLTTTLLAWWVMVKVWRWPVLPTAAIMSVLLAVDLVFLGANAIKFLDGGWFPSSIAAGIVFLLTTWKRGREIVMGHLAKQSIAVGPFIGTLTASSPSRVRGTAVFMTSQTDSVPHSLLHNLKHNQVLHDQVVLLTFRTADTPRVPAAERVTTTRLGEGFWRIEARYGFAEEPNVPDVLALATQPGVLEFEELSTSFFLSRETVIPIDVRGMALWREKLFAWMHRNAARASDFFALPSNRVVEMGAKLEI
jgi:KUP system potassium uptake protein